MTEHPGTRPGPYRDATALWRAVADRARAAARANPALTTSGLITEFLFGRLLARIFSVDDDSWVLKGGTAILARVHTARHSQDIDLFHRHGTIDDAVAELRELATIDLGDSFRFVVELGRPRINTHAQPGIQGTRIRVTAYCGVNKVGEIPIDLVVGAVITQEPDTVQPLPRLDVPGFAAPRYRLYPMVDHIADKLCATVERHGPDRRESSRPRDMVDLVVIARTQYVDAGPLWTAIEAERLHRGLDPITSYTAPSTWRTLYPAQARTAADCAGYATFDAAHTLIGTFLDPVLTREARDQRWDPDLGWL